MEKKVVLSMLMHGVREIDAILKELASHGYWLKKPMLDCQKMELYSDLARSGVNPLPLGMGI